VVFVVQNAPAPARELPGLTLSPMGHEEGAAVFDMIMNIWDTEHGLAGSFQYNPDLFNASTIKRMLDHYQRLLESIVADPDAPLDELEMLSEEEKALLEKPIVINEFEQGFAFYEQDAPGT
jgi:non-ribosomal peptide synthetase component F